MTTANTFFKFKAMSFIHPVFVWAATVAALIISAKVQVPMIPVPITFQTAVVLMIPCFFGWRLAMASIGSYFALGIAGLPVFSMAVGAVPGPAYFLGPTGGYLVGFVVAAALLGWIYFQRERWPVNNVVGLMLGGHATILALGFIWLAYGLPALGTGQAFAVGVLPFITGAIVKSLIAAFFVKAISSR